MVVNIKITSTTEDILKNYDADDLLRTIPNDYKLNTHILNSYQNKVHSTTPIDIELTDQMYNWVTALSENNNVPFALVFNFLIETVADCGKVNTKSVKHALNIYYHAVAHDRSLLSQILNEYAQSGFYSTETGLSEEGVAYFLTTSEIGRELIRNYNITPENPTGQSHTPTNQI